MCYDVSQYAYKWQRNGKTPNQALNSQKYQRATCPESVVARMKPISRITKGKNYLMDLMSDVPFCELVTQAVEYRHILILELICKTFIGVGKTTAGNYL